MKAKKGSDPGGTKEHAPSAGGEVIDGDLSGYSEAELAQRANDIRGAADGKIPVDVNRLTGPLSLRLMGIDDELVHRYPEADLAGLVVQLRHSIDGLPATVFESNFPVGVHAGDVTPQTIAALEYVVEKLLMPTA